VLLPGTGGAFGAGNPGSGGGEADDEDAEERLTKAMNGRLTIESRAGSGMTSAVVWPAWPTGPGS
jgi:hypothetical protein